MTNSEQHGRQAAAQDMKHRRLVRLLISISAVALVVFGGMVAVAATSSASAANHHTIYLQTKLVSATNNSAGLGGAGDVIANLNSFTTTSGVVGHADITCQIFPNSEQECTASFVFPDGQIDASAAITLPVTTFVAPITGGSGAYEGVTGQIDNSFVSPGVVNRTFHLIFPDHR